MIVDTKKLKDIAEIDFNDIVVKPYFHLVGASFLNHRAHRDTEKNLKF